MRSNEVIATHSLRFGNLCGMHNDKSQAPDDQSIAICRGRAIPGNARQPRRRCRQSCAIPSFATLSGGMINVTNTYGFDPTTHWSNTAFTSQALNLSGKHNPDQQWTVSPVSDTLALEAVRYACLWGVYGPPEPGSPSAEMLRAVKRNDDAKPHFGVDHWLDMLPPGWLGTGGYSDVPGNACYHSHCGGTYVWVCPENLPALSNFTLAILDIGTVVLSTITWQPAMATIDIKAKVAPTTCSASSPTDRCSPGAPIPHCISQSRSADGSWVADVPSPEHPFTEEVPSPSPNCPGFNCIAPNCPCRGTTFRCFPPPTGPTLGTPAGCTTTLTRQRIICQDETTKTIFIPTSPPDCTETPAFCFYTPTQTMMMRLDGTSEFVSGVQEVTPATRSIIPEPRLRGQPYLSR